MTDEEYNNYILTLFSKFNRILKDDGIILWNCSYASECPSSMFITISKIIQESNFEIGDVLIWKKSNSYPIQSKNKMRRTTEYIFVFCKKGHLRTYECYGKLPLCKGSRITRNRNYYNIISNFIEAKSNDEFCNLNKATFSTDLVKQLLSIYGKEGITVYDAFMGTGTTAVQCKRMNINYIGSELSKAQCEWQKIDYKRKIQFLIVKKRGKPMKIKYEELMEGVMITKGIRKALEILGHDLMEEIVEITIFLEDSKNDGKWHIFEMDTMTDTVVCTKQKNKIFMLLGDEAKEWGSKYMILSGITVAKTIFNCDIPQENIQPNGVDLNIISVAELTGKARITKDKSVKAFPKKLTPKRDKDGKLVFHLKPKKAYDIFYEQGGKIPMGTCAEVHIRSSLGRSGCLIANSLWDSGFETDQFGSILHIGSIPIDIEVGARVSQVVVSTSEEGTSYKGRWQGITADNATSKKYQK